MASYYYAYNFAVQEYEIYRPKLFAVIGHSSCEFVEGLCCTLTQCKESEVPNALIDILAVLDIIEDLEKEASKVGNAVLTHV